MLKQENVAQKYLEEKLDIHGAYIYADRFGIKLRGEDIEANAYIAHMKIDRSNN